MHLYDCYGFSKCRGIQNVFIFVSSKECFMFILWMCESETDYMYLLRIFSGF